MVHQGHLLGKLVCFDGSTRIFAGVDHRIPHPPYVISESIAATLGGGSGDPFRWVSVRDRTEQAT
jgi:hypothetical protein